VMVVYFSSLSERKVDRVLILLVLHFILFLIQSSFSIRFRLQSLPVAVSEPSFVFEITFAPAVCLLIS